MNIQRRKALAKALDLIDQGKADLEAVLSDEQEAFDNMPQGLQDGERGQTMQEGLDAIQAALDALADVTEGDCRSLAEGA